jgi:hypothetical protein
MAMLSDSARSRLNGQLGLALSSAGDMYPPARHFASPNLTANCASVIAGHGARLVNETQAGSLWAKSPSHGYTVGRAGTSGPHAGGLGR